MHNAILDRLNDHSKIRFCISQSDNIRFNWCLFPLPLLVPISEINEQFPDILYVVYENSVFDISDIQHPGG